MHQAESSGEETAFRGRAFFAVHGVISLSEMPGGFVYGLISDFRMSGILSARYCCYGIIIMVMQSVNYICLLRSSVIGSHCIDAIKRISEPIR